MSVRGGTSRATHPLIVGGVRFTLSGPLTVTRFPPAFRAFLDADVPWDLACRVRCRGADALLASEPRVPDQPWTFARDLENDHLIRRAATGETVWRIDAPRSFEQAVVRWHPSLFSACYSSYEYAWGTGLGLALTVMRLQAVGGVAFHGTAAEVDGQGILGLGISGSGKSTLARMLQDAGCAVLSDERPLVRRNPDVPPEGSGAAGFRVYGSPWPSSAGAAQNTHAPLRRIYFLEHGQTNRIRPLTPAEALSRMIPVTAIPWREPCQLDPYLVTIDGLLRFVPCSVFAFRPEPAAISHIREDLASLPPRGTP